jgi:hypothetical protein
MESSKFKTSISWIQIEVALAPRITQLRGRTNQSYRIRLFFTTTLRPEQWATKSMTPSVTICLSRVCSTHSRESRVSMVWTQLLQAFRCIQQNQALPTSQLWPGQNQVLPKTQLMNLELKETNRSTYTLTFNKTSIIVLRI